MFAIPYSNYLHILFLYTTHVYFTSVQNINLSDLWLENCIEVSILNCFYILNSLEFRTLIIIVKF